MCPMISQMNRNRKPAAWPQFGHISARRLMMCSHAGHSVSNGASAGRPPAARSLLSMLKIVLALQCGQIIFWPM